MANYSTYIEREEEKKSRRVGWIVTIAVHLIILLFFWWYNIWPFEPPVISHYGAEINFGISETGSGDVQNQTEPSPEDNENPVENQDMAAAANNAETQPETNESNENMEAFENDDAPPIANENDNPEEVNNEVENEEPAENPSENQNPNENDTPNENTSESNNDGTSDANPSAQENNNGNDTDEVGDKGQENGEINESDIYKGTPGDGGGSGAQITGWYTQDKVRKEGVVENAGKIIFYVKIDSYGEVVDVQVQESTVSATTVGVFKEQIKRMSFEQKDDSEDPAPFSEGTFTVILEAH